MAKLSKEDVKHIAKLSRLELSAEEVERFASQLSSVLDYVDELEEVDTEGVEATSQVTGLENVFRKDAVEKSDIDQKDVFDNAPASEKDSYKVPGVFKNQQ